MGRIDKRALQYYSAIAEKLVQVFADVTVHGVRTPISVTARHHVGKWTHPSCGDDHHVGHLLRLTDVHAPFARGQMGGDPDTATHFDELVYCSKCEKVVYFKV